MAKKKKRSKKRGQYRAAARRATPRPVASRATTTNAASRTKASPISREAITQAQVDFGEEYRYVIADLRNMGILAAAMFGLLGILALILR